MSMELAPITMDRWGSPLVPAGRRRKVWMTVLYYPDGVGSEAKTWAGFSCRWGEWWTDGLAQGVWGDPEDDEPTLPNVPDQFVISMATRPTGERWWRIIVEGEMFDVHEIDWEFTL